MPLLQQRSRLDHWQECIQMLTTGQEKMIIATTFIALLPALGLAQTLPAPRAIHCASFLAQ